MVAVTHRGDLLVLLSPPHSPSFLLDGSYQASADLLGECASVTVDVEALALPEAHQHTRGTLLICPLLCVL